MTTYIEKLELLAHCLDGDKRGVMVGKEWAPTLDGAASHIATLETALLTIIKSMNEYLPPSGGDKDRFINEVIGAVDNAIVAKALEKGR